LSQIVTLQDKTNALLKRREVSCLFRGHAGKLSRNDAVNLLTTQLKLDKKIVIPVTLKCETGRTDVKGTFYVYDDETLAKKHLPKYVFLRLLSKEERKKIAEAEKAKAKAKKEGAAPKAEAEPKTETPSKEERKEPEKKEETPKEKAKPEAKGKESAEAKEAK
jgi:small subunit ribosomal protein S24e